MQKRFWVLFVLALFSIITYLDRTSISITGSQITQDLHLSEKEFGWIMGSFAFAYGIFEIPVGLWGDFKGPKSVLFRPK
jgi:sugar phosphate permease